MPLLLPRRLRRARAELTIEVECEAPPDPSSGGVVLVRVLLLPGEPLTITRGLLELSLVTTRFSRTVLDGYLEHSTEKVFRTVRLCANCEARAGNRLEWSANVPLFIGGQSVGKPTRLQWKVQARFDVKGRREIRTATSLSPLGLDDNQGPVVDGTGFLPL